MQLYHTPGTCSTASRIVLQETGIAASSIPVNLREKTLPDGTSYLQVNPKGQVPALVLDDGDVLTEGAIILQYLADQAPESGLLPPPGDLARYRVLEWTNYVATELHKTFTPLMRPNTPPDFAEITKTALLPRVFGTLDRRLGLSDYLAGATFSIADAYAFVILGWAKLQAIDLAAWPNIQAYLKRIESRPSVQSLQ
ncbi:MULTISPECIES: glutathione transferase GstA [Rhizobium/Agrobacterium group]|uniref:glutathione transferase GstA n=1 Tax=Rhizobium/Agrobacterium group TaxID=227290 RepID=UPI0012E857C4|nr:MULTISPECIES: glutathione transferase GstA [Rhizobium/Agrobacterium group]MCF1491382.1 glutathione transferase GstA [Allorhizobium ampelinum]MVA43945.1 glutathione transferase GstA [Agrobacterium vitis]MVA60064.1 glutathione transferase GstA [Agrobacterium vitis]